LKILCVMDAHLGELHNIVPMFFHWGKNGELKHCHIDFVYIGHDLNASIIQNELNILCPFVSFKLVILPIVSPTMSGLYKFINFFRLSIWYIFLGRYCLRFIPYDQRPLFNKIFMLGSGKLIAVPHTTGDEVYSAGVFKNKQIRSKKKFPVITKSSASKEYFSALGFNDCIVTGKYFESKEYLDVIIPSVDAQDANLKLCIFTLSRITKLFSQKNWLQVHHEILISAAQAGFSQIFIKLHPSQPKEDLDDLFIFAEKLPLKIFLVSGNPSVAVSQFDIFITVLTSAGQHAKSLGKPVCCYASASMRQEVADFGNDPYPYKRLDVAEVVYKENLIKWLKNSLKHPTTPNLINENNLLSLKDLLKFC